VSFPISWGCAGGAAPRHSRGMPANRQPCRNIRSLRLFWLEIFAPNIDRAKPAPGAFRVDAPFSSSERLCTAHIWIRRLRLQEGRVRPNLAGKISTTVVVAFASTPAKFPAMEIRAIERSEQIPRFDKNGCSRRSQNSGYGDDGRTPLNRGGSQFIQRQSCFLRTQS
jgi:hypothetical protein